MLEKLASRKFLVLVAYWAYALGGLVTGQLDAKASLEALGTSGGAYLVVQGVIDAVKTWKKS